MKRLEISSRFTIEDIHKIRDYNDEIIKNMTSEEIVEYYSRMGQLAKENLDIVKSDL